jgi:hypothetical protein
LQARSKARTFFSLGGPAKYPRIGANQGGSMLSKRVMWMFVLAVVFAVSCSSIAMSQCACGDLMTRLKVMVTSGDETLSTEWMLMESIDLYFHILHCIGDLEFQASELDLSPEAEQSYFDLYHSAVDSAEFLLTEVLVAEALAEEASGTFVYAANAMSLSSGLLAECGLWCSLAEGAPPVTVLKAARELDPSVKAGLKQIAAWAAQAIGRITIKLPRIWLPWPFKQYIGGQTILTIDITAIINRALEVANEILHFIGGGEYERLRGD